jgi:predicted RNA-binding Zn ribbon-like protein
MTEEPVNSNLLVTREGTSLPPILSLPLVSERPCLNFVNTIDWRLDSNRRRDTLNCYSDLLAFTLRLNLLSVESYTGLSEQAQTTVAERALRDARTFRDALASIIDDINNPQEESRYKTIHPEALSIFDAARRKAHESESLNWAEDRLTVQPSPEEEGLDLPWLILVRDAEKLLYSSEAARIHICAAMGCGWVFLDLSKNGTRRWCSMELCGNREKAARFKAKRRS